MVQIIEALKNNHIIDSQNVKAIKSYIRQKYPNDSADHTASIFADVIHKIIDNNIIHFDEPSRVSIKRNLLRGISQKKEIEINAFEVFEVCTQLYEAGGDYIERLTNWINHNQQQIVSVDEVTQLTTEVRKSLPDSIKTNDIIDATDATEASSNFSKFNPATEALIARLAQLNEDPLYFPSSVTRNSTTKVVNLLEQKKNIELSTVDNELSLETSKEKSITRRSIRTVFFRLKDRQKEILATLLFFTGLLALNNSFEYFNHGKSPNITSTQTYEISNVARPIEAIANNTDISQNHLPKHLQYKSINLESLRNWLAERDSALADEPYFNCINETAEEYGINPLLLFAITGQEQGFVPKTNKDAAVIANNPFNVFGSWEDYNTNIDESSRIAAITILNLSKDCPEDTDMIKWINRKYAEDENWHIGVTKIFSQLEKATNLKE